MFFGGGGGIENLNISVEVSPEIDLKEPKRAPNESTYSSMANTGHRGAEQQTLTFVIVL